MSPLSVALVLGTYIGLLLVVAWRASGRGDNSTFFAGGHNQNVWTVTMGRISASMSGVTFVSVPGMVVHQDFTYLQMALGFVAGQMVIAFVLVPLYFRLRVVSIYEYLESRFGLSARRSGAWLFFVSKLLGTAVRLMLVCVVLQSVMWDVLGVPFAVNVVLTVAVTWLYTVRGGVSSVVWTDVIKTAILLGTVAVIASLVAGSAGVPLWQMAADSVRDKHIIDCDWNSPTHFLKHFVAGALSVVAMTGLDQDMMQRTLACRTARDAQRNVVISGVLQFAVIALLLTLGAMMAEWLIGQGGVLPEVGDELFPMVAVSAGLPIVAGVMFVLGLAASSFSSAGSAVTALTTTFSLDILGGEERFGIGLKRVRRWVHSLLAIVIATLIIILHGVGNMSAIDTVFRLAAYTYGPLLGLFVFGLVTERRPHPVAIPVLSVAAPALSLAVARITPVLFDGFHFGHDILMVNAIFMFVGLACFSQKK
ncbi:MAG: sodium:solute symporter [Rikenellaceae bacterium]|nr:sodium:solute symporter [Rikenellaceae bacterium]